MKTINALSARSRLGTLLDEVSQEGVHYIIERLRQPLVVVIPFREYQTIFSQKASEKHKEELMRELDSFRRKYGKQLSGRKGTTRLLREMRAGRTKHLINLIQ